MSKYIEQCVAIGDRRQFVSALIVPMRENLIAWAESEGLSTADYNNLLNNPAVQELYDAELAKTMQGFSHYEIIKKFALLPDLWTIESGEITPSLKVKRKVVIEKNTELIESIYN